MVSCPTCAAALRFDIAEQKMVCDHCANRFDVQSLRDNSSRDDAKASQFDSYVYLCPSCGAELVTTDKNDAVGFCQYCGGASMLFDKMRQEWKPDAIIPFQVTKEQCKKAYVKEVKRHFFVSRKYANADLIDRFRGVYMPYWSYRAVMQGYFTVRATAPREHVSLHTYEIKHYDIGGQSNYTMDGYSRDASIAFDDDISETLAPFDYSGQQPFMPGYLSGFYAETGNVNPHEYDAAVTEEMQQDAVSALSNDPSVQNYLKKWHLTPQNQYSAAPVQIHSVRRTLNPVWFMSRRDGKEITYAVVNGQTGKVSADLPLSPLRILLTALAVSAAIFGVLMLLMNYIPSIKANSTLTLCLLLMNAGMYYLQKSFNRTVDKDWKNTTRKTPLIGSGGFTFALVLAFLSFIAIVSDGSYSTSLGDLAIFPFLISLCLMAAGHFGLAMETGQIRRLKINKESLLSVRLSQEGKKFLNGVIWLKIVMYITLVIGAMIAYADLANRFITYGMCIVCAAELFGLAVFHIYFQTQVAKRPLPQFNKKGARYDEN